jgi:cytochrome c biogenesis protein
VLVGYLNALPLTLPLVIILSLLAGNLLAVIVSSEHFRRQLPLLIFHLALLAIILLVGLGRLVYFKGQAEVLEGEEFDGQLVKSEAGPWHPWSLDQARFVNRGFSVAYAPGLVRLGTENRVAWVNPAGRIEEDVIGDHRPLVLQGYRFYTSWNKGFALLFEWTPDGGEALLGSVNLPGYPGNALKQAQKWALPGVPDAVWAMLQFDGELIPLDRAGEFRLPDDYRVVVRHGEQRWELSPAAQSDEILLPGGRLRYVGLRSWMGYHITWDGTIDWLLAASAIAVLALAWHFWRQFASRPWNPD